LISICLIAMFSVLGPAPAARAACDCGTANIADSLASQQVAFVGELTTSELVDPLAVYTFTISGIYKGEATLETKVGTLLSVDDCGIGPDALPGRWIVFASRFPDETGPLLMNRCTATGPLPTDQPIPVELGEAVLPPELVQAPEAAPPAVAPPRIVWKGLPDWRPPVVKASIVFIGLGLLARILAGRRRSIVS
jgi:hypothetical protein